MTDLERPIDGTDETVEKQPIEENSKSGSFTLNIDMYSKELNPKKYFLTSGDAVSKTEKLIEDIQGMLSNIKGLHHDLLELRGENKFLETEINKGKITMKIKNPRSKKEKLVNTKIKLSDLKGLMNYGDVLYVKEAKSKGVKTYCSIDPDKEEYVYFNSYNGSISEKIPEKSGIDNVSKFIKKLEKNEYKRVLI